MELKYKIQKMGGKWETIGSFTGTYNTEAEAQAEADRRNSPAPKPQIIQQAEPESEPTEAEIKAEIEHQRYCMEHGISIVPNPRFAKRISRRFELYNQEPPEE